jgi:hypothetical protein
VAYHVAVLGLLAQAKREIAGCDQQEIADPMWQAYFYMGISSESLLQAEVQPAERDD